MTVQLLICAAVLILCLASSKLSHRFGVPTLLFFILLGMLFGSDGLFKIQFDNYQFAEQICSIALIFIMFYGGFGTNWKIARPVASKSILLSSLGVILTALITGLFCHFLLKMDLLEGLLIGSVIGSTDAASVFAILRSKNLGLKDGLASMLEIESGSNDPTAYMLTVILLSIMANSSAGTIGYILFAQIVFGLIFGFAVGYLSIFLMKKINFEVNGLHTIFVVAIAIFAYAAPAVLGGNGYLSAYIAGILIGNSNIFYKKELVHFFDGLTWLMQILLFFLLGLLSFPSQMPSILLPAVGIFLFLTFVARPAAVFAILTPFRVPLKQQLFVSWAGLRGAASIVFAILTVTSSAYLQTDVFHVAFCVALLSVAFQGSLLPLVAKKLDLIDADSEVLKTFTDYQEDPDMNLIEFKLDDNNPYTGKKLQDVTLPPDSLVVLIQRGDETIIPRGSTVLEQGDVMVMSCSSYQDRSQVKLKEIEITAEHSWLDKTISEIDLPKNNLVVLIKRKSGSVIPKGENHIQAGDVLVITQAKD